MLNIIIALLGVVVVLSVIIGCLPPRLRRAGLERKRGVHDILPCALCQCRVGVLQINLGDLQIHGRLPGGFALIFGAQTGLSAGRRFLGVENARSSEQDESRFHELIL